MGLCDDGTIWVKNETPLILSESEFKICVQEGDGICSLCKVWSSGTAEPDGEGVFCIDCENRSIVGMRRAKAMGLVEVK